MEFELCNISTVISAMPISDWSPKIITTDKTGLYLN